MSQVCDNILIAIHFTGWMEIKRCPCFEGGSLLPGVHSHDVIICSSAG